MPTQISVDFREEAAELYLLLLQLSPKDWETPTLFMDWTPWDVVAHLHYFDEVSLHAAEGEEAFAERRRTVMKAAGSGMSTRDLQRKELGDCDAPALLERWKTTCDALSAKLGEVPPKARLPWFGPDMGAQMFTTARYMETWAHAQEIYDLKGVDRDHTDRVRNIVAIGARTFSWTFVNRGRKVPATAPYLRLIAPSGEIWEHNEPNDRERVEGQAVDFCQVVTQVRNVRDTRLQVTGDIAREWMDIAQCFAGPPADPPAPGTRVPSAVP